MKRQTGGEHNLVIFKDTPTNNDSENSRRDLFIDMVVDLLLGVSSIIAKLRSPRSPSYLKQV